MFERLTDRARRVIVLAQEESRRLGHDYIGTEHILLGLIEEGNGVAAKALESLGISLEAVRQQVEEIIGLGQAAPTGHIPFTPGAKEVLQLSLREALQLGHNHIGTEHLLLGLIREGEGVAAQVLERFKADLNRVREEVIRILDNVTGEDLAEREGSEPARVSPQPPEVEPLEAPSAKCPRCREKLSDTIAYETKTVQERGGEGARDVVIVFCNRCGNALGAF